MNAKAVEQPMTRNAAGGGVIRIASGGHAAYAAMMIALGILGLVSRNFTAVWAPVPKGAPARVALIYVCALVSLGCGIGLLVRRTAAAAARVLLAALILWFLLWRVRFLFVASLIEGTWSCGDTLMMTAGAWVLYVWFATDRDRERFPFATGDRGLRIARVLYGLAMIPFGYAHFANVSGTAELVPGWLPWHVFWAYFTGAAFIAAAVAILAGVWARLAAVLSALMMGLFSVIIWIPKVTSGPVNAFQWGEFWTTFALTAAGWVVADSYRGEPWLAAGRRRSG
jgi:uncharacterized membrane protein